jgi:putative transcriptional regulator
MGKMSEKELIARDRRRDIGAELVRAVRQMKAGKAGRVHQVKVPEALEARMRSGLSQAKFASALGVSKRTLQEWEQGRRKPTGAARSLLTIASKRPEILREVLVG